MNFLPLLENSALHLANHLLMTGIYFYINLPKTVATTLLCLEPFGDKINFSVHKT